MTTLTNAAPKPFKLAPGRAALLLEAAVPVGVPVVQVSVLDLVATAVGVAEVPTAKDWRVVHIEVEAGG